MSLRLCVKVARNKVNCASMTVFYEFQVVGLTFSQQMWHITHSPALGSENSVVHASNEKKRCVDPVMVSF